MDLTEYLNNSVRHIFQEAMMSFRLNPKEISFLNREVKAQKVAAKKRQQSETLGTSVPPFLIASIATKCNLHCIGCYARANNACKDDSLKDEMSAKRWGEIFDEALALGVSFILLAGGEPLERTDVLNEAAQRPNLIFPVFTNGTLFTPSLLERFGQHRNLVPVISIEGNQEQTDHRRGEGVFERVHQTLKSMAKYGMLYGVSITVAKGNLSTVTSDAFVSSLLGIGCRLMFLVEYVPADGNFEPVLNEKDRLALENRQNELKSRYPDMIILSFPGDEKKLGGCLAAGRGFFHIAASGAAEPCPFSPFSDINLKANSLKSALDSTLFRAIRESHFDIQEHSGGCVLFSRKAEVKNLLSGVEETEVKELK